MNDSMICPKCRVIKYQEEDVENIQEFGECLTCESCRLDIDPEIGDDGFEV